MAQHHSTPSGAEDAPRTLILGYGNVDRGDDGLGYYVVSELARCVDGIEVEPYDDIPTGLTEQVDLLFVRQLTPELAETLAEYDRVFFVDAHTGAYAEDLRMVEVESRYLPSALTHHMTAETLLDLTEVMFGRKVKGYLYSARGYDFDFTPHLSERTRAAAEQIIAELLRQVRS